jgi:RNA polymerase sigma factor (sigma-70 family)
MLQDDAALVGQVLSGNKSAFGPLIERHRPGAIRLARRRLGDPADAEDVVQEALLHAFLGLQELRAPDRFGAWLAGIVVNLCRMRWRARYDVSPLEDWHGGRVVPDFPLADTQPSPEALAEVRECHQLVLGAIVILPAEQQQAVRLHYLDGLLLREVGLLAGVLVATVKVRLHRARARLRREVARRMAGVAASIPGLEEEVAMVEVTVDDIIVRVPKGAVATWTGPQGDKGRRDRFGHLLDPKCVVLLKERTGERLLPMWVGRFEANALALQLRAISTPRPMTHDLTARLLEVAETEVEKVTVTSLHENTYYATIGVRVGARVHDVDARPSDALTLALRTNAPIFVAPELFAHAPVAFLTPEGGPTAGGYVVRTADGRQMRGPALLPLLEAWHRKNLEEKGLPPETPEREYLSFRSLPSRAAGDQPRAEAKAP